MAIVEDIVALYQQGEAAALCELWEGVKLYAFKIVSKYKGLAEVDDLQQMAFLGVQKAAECFDTQKGTPFLPYMGKAVEHTLKRYIRENRGGARLPEYKQKQVEALRRYKSDYYKATGKTPTRQQACDFLDITDDELMELDLWTASPKSLESPLKDNDDITLADMVADDRDDIEAADRTADHEQIAAYIRQSLDEIGGIEAEAIRKRYFECMSVKAAAASLNITPAKLRHTESMTLRTLREPKHSRRLRGYYTDYLQGLYHLGGLAHFNHTWTSEVESIALKHLGGAHGV